MRTAFLLAGWSFSGAQVPDNKPEEAMQDTLTEEPRNANSPADVSVPDSDLKPGSLPYKVLTAARTEPLLFARVIWHHFLDFWEFYPTRLWIDDWDKRSEFQYFNTEFYRSTRNLLSALSFGPELLLALLGSTGFRAARTQYVMQLDSDDLLEATAVAKYVDGIPLHHISEEKAA